MRLHDHLPAGEPTSVALDSGRALRRDQPRSGHADLTLSRDRNPLAVIEHTHADRIPELVGVRVARMLQSPFAFFRATADVMTADLADGTSTGIDLVVNGDAHLANFGLYATPERRLVFDLNDFDESGIGPWEWDVKRLATSVDLVLRDLGLDAGARRTEVSAVVAAYRDSLAERVAQSALDRYFSSVEADWLLESASGREEAELDRTIRKARRRTSEQVLEKITTSGPSGEHRIVAQPPLLVPADPLALDEVQTWFASYLDTLRTDRAMLISQFRVVDAARRVVGVGSVGTRCAIVLLEGPSGEALVLQVKEAGRSVLAAGHTHRDITPDHAPAEGREGYRVVSCQQVLQSASDPFLGWTTGPDGRSFYWRQFRDMKGSVDLSRLRAAGVNRYGRLCAALLARAHAQSPDAAVVSGYLGTGTVFCDSVARWAAGYGDVVESDFADFAEAARSGRFPVADED